MSDGLQRAIDAMGGATRLADAIGVSIQTLTNWKARGVPAEHCPAIERETRAAGKAVLCEQLRPDIGWDVLRTEPKKRVAGGRS